MHGVLELFLAVCNALFLYERYWVRSEWTCSFRGLSVNTRDARARATDTLFVGSAQRLFYCAARKTCAAYLDVSVKTWRKILDTQRKQAT